MTKGTNIKIVMECVFVMADVWIKYIHLSQKDEDLGATRAEFTINKLLLHIPSLSNS